LKLIGHLLNFLTADADSGYWPASGSFTSSEGQAASMLMYVLRDSVAQTIQPTRGGSQRPVRPCLHP